MYKGLLHYEHVLLQKNLVKYEKFFKNLQESSSLDFISFLKFRGGYGQIGNSEPAGDFAYKGTTR